MNYFNGFSLKGEEVLFKEQLIDGDYVVAGFSYGAQKAFEYVYSSSKRVDRLILLSPAFFQEEKKSFIKMQLRYFKTNKKSYIENFLNNVASPSSEDLTPFLCEGSIEELEELLSYVWDRDKIQEIIKRGVTIEVFMGDEDKIVNSNKSRAFFSEFATLYYIKGVGHLLK